MPKRTRPVNVLVVGQTPPPFGGQAVMIQALLDGHYERIRLHHVRLRFSDDMESVGKASLRKVWVLFTTIPAIWFARLRHGTPVLYYPPAGPNRVPVLRDLVLLTAVRWMFRHTVFHFHAGGVSGFRDELPAIMRPLFRCAYGTPSLAIRTAPQNPDDGRALGARRDVVIPNGIADMGKSTVPIARASGAPLIILFTGVLIASKGVRVLLDAFAIIARTTSEVRLQFMGKWGSEPFRAECERFLGDNGLTGRVEFLGVKRDAEKAACFAACDIFCFPSCFEAESFGLVLVEAMQFAKPVVATAWRGIPSVVSDGVNGFLVPINDAQAVAARLQQLIDDPALRGRMGREGRRIFEERFTLERFRNDMEIALADVMIER